MLGHLVTRSASTPDGVEDRAQLAYSGSPAVRVHLEVPLQVMGVVRA